MHDDIYDIMKYDVMTYDVMTFDVRPYDVMTYDVMTYDMDHLTVQYSKILAEEGLPYDYYHS